jgi:hypothetical protein
MESVLLSPPCERRLAVGAERCLLALQAFAFVARPFRVWAETRRVVGAGTAKAARPHSSHAQARRVCHETQPVAHAERAMAAMRLLGTACDGQKNCEREGETSAPNSAAGHDRKSLSSPRQSNSGQRTALHRGPNKYGLRIRADSISRATAGPRSRRGQAH